MNIHELTGLSAECVLKNSLNSNSLDNVSVIIIALPGIAPKVNKNIIKPISNNLQN